MNTTESHRVAVVARYLGPTDTKGSRIKVRRGDHKPGDPTLTWDWDHRLNLGENYAAAIGAYVTKLGWDEGGTWVTGSTTDGYVAVFVKDGAR